MPAESAGIFIGWTDGDDESGLFGGHLVAFIQTLEDDSYLVV